MWAKPRAAPPPSTSAMRGGGTLISGAGAGATGGGWVASIWETSGLDGVGLAPPPAAQPAKNAKLASKQAARRRVIAASEAAREGIETDARPPGRSHLRLQVVVQADFGDQSELRLEPIHVLLFTVENVLEQLAADIVAARFAVGDRLAQQRNRLHLHAQVALERIGRILADV